MRQAIYRNLLRLAREADRHPLKKILLDVDELSHELRERWLRYYPIRYTPDEGPSLMDVVRDVTRDPSWVPTIDVAFEAMRYLNKGAEKAANFKTGGYTLPKSSPVVIPLEDVQPGTLLISHPLEDPCVVLVVHTNPLRGVVLPGESRRKSDRVWVHPAVDPPIGTSRVVMDSPGRAFHVSWGLGAKQAENNLAWDGLVQSGELQKIGPSNGHVPWVPVAGVSLEDLLGILNQVAPIFSVEIRPDDDDHPFLAGAIESVLALVRPEPGSLQAWRSIYMALGGDYAQPVNEDDERTT